MNPSPTISDALRAGIEHQRRGQLAEARRIYQSILEKTPDHADALHLLGIIAVMTGQPDKAVDLIRHAIVANPAAAAYHDDLGIALAGLGREDEAIASHQKALELNPKLFNAHFNLAGVLILSGRFDQALASFNAALELKPDDANAHNGIGVACILLHRLDDALAAFNRAKQLNPNSAQAEMNLGNVRLDCGQHDAAMAHFDRALSLEPTKSARLSNRIFALHYHPRSTAADLLAAARQWHERIGQPLQASIRPHSNDRRPDRKLRIGYVSPDFRKHVISRCMLPVLANHDRGQFEIYCYASVAHEDEMTSKLRQHSDAWRDIRRFSDQRVADMIREDRIDILVDLALHSLGNRLTVFARKPAPVQITYLGYCSTTGLSAMDYRLSDPHVDPADSADYSEKTIRLPNTYLCYELEHQTPQISPPPCMARGSVTFGCLNNFTKSSSDALDLWGQILQSVPDSRLILHAKPGQHLQNVREQFARWGVSPDRLEFLGRQDWPQYIETYSRIDIALDPLPYNGGVTTCDALWMGVPIVTLSGRTAVGRVGRSFLSNVGFPQWIAQTPQQYLKLAVELAGDFGLLQELRPELRSRLRGSPLMNPVQLTRDIESAFRQTWQNYCKEP
jgi:protein O-GlcNAc transferase